MALLLAAEKVPAWTCLEFWTRMRARWTWGSPVPTGEWPAREYTYVCQDRSVLLPWLLRLAVRPAASVTPLSVAPNDLTIAGFVASLAPVAFMFGWPPCLAAAGLFAYLVLDQLDGLQARRRGTSSPLGEFLDHWLDAWNAGLVGLVLGLSGGVPGSLLTWFVALSMVAFLVTLSEHRRTGVLRLERFGSVEAVALAALVYLAASVWGAAAVGPVVGVLGVAGLFGMAGTIAVVVRRAGWIVVADCLPLLLVAAAAFSWNGLEAWLGALMVTAAGVVVAGRVILGRLLGETLSGDALGTVAAWLGCGLSWMGGPGPAAGPGPGLGLAVLTLLLWRAGADARATLRLLGCFVERGELLGRWRR